MAKIIKDTKNKVEFSESVFHPKHYGGEASVYEAIKVIEAWDLGFNLGNVVKYITRHRRKGEGASDIEKVIHYCELILEKDYGRK